MTCAPRTGAPPIVTVPLSPVFAPMYGVLDGVGTTVRAAGAGVACCGGAVICIVAIGVGTATVGWTLAALPA